MSTEGENIDQSGPALLPCVLLSNNTVDVERFLRYEKIDKKKYDSAVNELLNKVTRQKLAQNPYLDKTKEHDVLSNDETLGAILNHTMPSFRCHGLTLGQMKFLGNEYNIHYRTTGWCCSDCYDEGHPRSLTHIFQCSREGQGSGGCCIS